MSDSNRPATSFRGIVSLITLIIICLAPLHVMAGSKKSSQPAGEYVVHFRDRAVDLEPYLQSYPYVVTNVDLKNGSLLYFDTQSDGEWLCHLPISAEGELSLGRGRKIGDTDWSLRSWWNGEFNPADDLFYFSSDEANDEHTNVYTLDLNSGEIKQVTRSDYTYAWGLSADGRYLAYVDRTGLQEPFVSTLRVLDLVTGAERAILDDAASADRFTWSEIPFTADNRNVIVTVQHDTNRRTTSLALVNLDNPSLDYIHEPRVERFGVDILKGWIDDHTFVFQSSETGFTNSYLCDLNARAVRQLTDYRENTSSVHLLETEPPTLLVPVKRPHETDLQLLDARTGELLHHEVIGSAMSIKDDFGNQAIMSRVDLVTPFKLERLNIKQRRGKWSFGWEPFISMPQALAKQLVNCKPEKVSYPTFDKTDDGSQRMLHAFYMEPLVQPVDENRLVIIMSFYGGGNYFSKRSHILGGLGIAFMSPSPRGCGGFGAEFKSLNDGDLGGDEIIDVFYAARWLVEEKGYKPSQIGVIGGSHGGYATMRCLTFPTETNGRNENFDFGFGISHAGFCDITTFYDTCNIPDWVVLEAGDPATEFDKLMERSPISHVERLRAPLLLTHGVNDWRVPISESRRFAEAAKAIGAPVTLVEFPGQGHGISGLANNLNYYQAIVDFLEALPR
ncbi:MAG: S9 family peptidase [bacterium]|nr:S9 family peptidase [bacterium]